MNPQPLLSVRSLSARYGGSRGAGDLALRDVDLDVQPGEILGLIGETGSGKTTFARTVMGLLDPVGGEIRFEEMDLVHLGQRQRRALRRSGKLQMVFQDPLRSLDPDRTVNQIVGEGLAVAKRTRTRDPGSAVRDALDLVGLPAEIASRLPAQISGGQRQRVAIARALVLDPRLLLCDEPVSALDVSTRNFVLNILGQLRQRLGLAIVVISHDLVSLAGTADRVAVLYRGEIVEDGPLEAVFANPAHPYTALLVASAPNALRARWGPGIERGRLVRPGRAPSAVPSRAGCAYEPRCPFATEECRVARPLPVALPGGRAAACHYALEWAGALEERVPAMSTARKEKSA